MAASQSKKRRLSSDGELSGDETESDAKEVQGAKRRWTNSMDLVLRRLDKRHETMNSLLTKHFTAREEGARRVENLVAQILEVEVKRLTQ